MQPNNRSSFIPKKSIKRVERVRSGKRVYILSYVAYAVFFGTIVVAGAVFFYSQLLEKELATKIGELETQRVAFNQSNIQKVKEVERQLKMADYFFKRHSSPYAALHELERIAVDKITFNTFDYNRVDSDTIELTISGGTDRFDGVAFQSGLLADSPILKSAEFSGISKQGEFSVVSNTTRTKNNSSNKNTDTDNTPALPVTFTINKVLGFDDLPYNPSIYTSSIIASTPDFNAGSSTAEVTNFTDSSDVNDSLDANVVSNNEFEQ